MGWCRLWKGFCLIVSLWVIFSQCFVYSSQTHRLDGSRYLSAETDRKKISQDWKRSRRWYNFRLRSEADTLSNFYGKHPPQHWSVLPTRLPTTFWLLPFFLLEHLTEESLFSTLESNNHQYLFSSSTVFPKICMKV